MKTNNEIFQKTVLDSKSMFTPEGVVKVVPCSWECKKQVAPEARSLRGRMAVDTEGMCTFTPYVRTSERKRYTRLYSIDFGEIRATKRDIVLTVRLPRKADKRSAAHIIAMTSMEAIRFVNSRQEKTFWES